MKKQYRNNDKNITYKDIIFRYNNFKKISTKIKINILSIKIILLKTLKIEFIIIKIKYKIIIYNGRF